MAGIATALLNTAVTAAAQAEHVALESLNRSITAVDVLNFRGYTTGSAETIGTDVYTANTVYVIDAGGCVITANVISGISYSSNGSGYVISYGSDGFACIAVAPGPAPPALPEFPTPAQMAEWEFYRAAHQKRLTDRAEAQAEWNRRQEAERAALAEREIQRQAAEFKAELLLTTHLAPEQRERYRRERKFEVVLKARFGLGSKRYLVEHGWSGNVYLLDKEGRPVERYCIHHPDFVPVPDLMLAQKLMLETDEEQFLKIANRTRLAVA